MENENVCRRKAQTAAERKRKLRQKKMSQMTEEEVKQFKFKGVGGGPGSKQEVSLIL